MVTSGSPQGKNQSLVANTNNPPQNSSFGPGGVSPGVDSELHEETAGVFGGMVFDDGVETGNVLVMEV